MGAKEGSENALVFFFKQRTVGEGESASAGAPAPAPLPAHHHPHLTHPNAPSCQKKNRPPPPPDRTGVSGVMGASRRRAPVAGAGSGAVGGDAKEGTPALPGRATMFEAASPVLPFTPATACPPRLLGSRSVRVADEEEGGAAAVRAGRGAGGRVGFTAGAACARCLPGEALGPPAGAVALAVTARMAGGGEGEGGGGPTAGHAGVGWVGSRGVGPGGRDKRRD